MNEAKYLRIDAEISMMTPILANYQIYDLETTILERKEKTVIYTWRGIIVYNIYEYNICKKNNIEFIEKELRMRNRQEVIKWLCRRLLEEQDVLVEPLKKYIIGKLFVYEKLNTSSEPPMRNQFSKDIGLPKNGKETARMLSFRLGREFNLSNATIQKYGIYCDAINRIATKEPDFAKQILEGKIKLSHDNLYKISNASASSVEKVAKNLIEYNERRLAYRGSHRDFKSQGDAINPNLEIPKVKIKEAPEYNPDVELTSLSFTVPTWARTIEKAVTNTNFDEASKVAKKTLLKQLSLLISSTAKIVELIKEENYE